MRQNRGWIDALLMILFLHIILNMVQIDAYLIEMLMLRKQKKTSSLKYFIFSKATGSDLSCTLILHTFKFRFEFSFQNFSMHFERTKVLMFKF